MLPYGYRARFTASTWSDSGERHRIRLAFAERKQASAAVYTWRSGEPDRALAIRAATSRNSTACAAGRPTR